MNVNPGQDPSDGPNYFNFDDTVRYAINIDNNADGKADNIVYEFQFKTENRPVGALLGRTSPVIVQSASLNAFTDAFLRASDSIVRSVVFAAIGATLLTLLGFFCGYLVHSRALSGHGVTASVRPYQCPRQRFQT